MLCPKDRIVLKKQSFLFFWGKNKNASGVVKKNVSKSIFILYNIVHK